MSEPKICVVLVRENMFILEKFTPLAKKFTLLPEVVGVTNITSGLRHLVTYKAGLLKKKQDRQLQIKYLWEKRWHGADNENEKSDINLFLRQNSPPSDLPLEAS